MIQKFRFTLVLLALNAIAFVALFILSSGQYKNYRESQGLNHSITSFTQSLEGIQIKSKQIQESINISKRNNRWFIDSPVQWPANNFSVNQIIHQLNLLKESAKFTYDELIETDQNLKDFGLDDPKLTFNLKKGSQSLSLLVGNSTPLRNKLYIYLPEKESVYVVESDLLKDDVLKVKDLYSKQIFDIPNFEIDALNYQLQASEKDSRGQLSVRLEKNINDGSWQFMSPLNVKADSVLVAKTLQALTETAAEKFLSLEIVDSDMLGFENPYMKISLQGNKRRNTLILGNTLNDPNNSKIYYAKLEGNPTVFTVKGDQCDQFIQAHKDLREKNFIKLNTKSISTIDVSDLEKFTKLQKLENNEWQALSLNENTPTKPFQADSEVIDNLIKNLNTLRAVGFFSDNPTEEDLIALKFNQPLLQILIFNNEENILTLNAVPHPNEKTLLLAKTENSPTIYTVDKASYHKNFSAQPLFYKNRVIEKLPEVARILELKIKDISNDALLYEYSSEKAVSETPLQLLDSLKEFKVHRYIDTVSLAKNNSNSLIDWKYKLSFKIALPGDIEDKLEERIYYFNERSSGSSQLGKTANQDLVFELSPELIQALHPFISSFELTPESTDLEVPDPSPVEKLPYIELPTQ